MPAGPVIRTPIGRISHQFDSQGVRFVGIDSNRQDSLDELRQFVTEYKLPFPVAKDHDNVVADQLNADRMTEVFWSRMIPRFGIAVGSTTAIDPALPVRQTVATICGSRSKNSSRARPSVCPSPRSPVV